jgi:hypothetical protein
MAILLMPTLARAGQEWHEAQLPPPPQEEPPPPPTYEGVKGQILKLIDTYKAKQQEKEEAFNESLKPSPSDIIPDVLSLLLKSVHCDEPPVLDATLVRKLLILHGECERAADPIMVDKMVEAATSSSGLFDQEAFTKALTSDLSEWNIGAEDKNTTSFYDVWGYSNYYEKAILEVEKQEAEQEAKEAAARGDEEQAASTIVQDEGFHLPKSLRHDSTKNAGSIVGTLDSVKSEVEDNHDQIEGIANDQDKELELTLSSFEHTVTGEEQTDGDGTLQSAIMDTEGAAVSLVKEAETEGVNLAKGAGTAGVDLAKGAGTQGVNLAKQAGAGGAKMVKGAQKGGAKEFKAEKIALAENPGVKIMEKIIPGRGGKHSDLPESEKDPADMDRVETELEAHRADRAESPHKLHHLSPKNAEASGDTGYKVNQIRSMMAIDSATDVYSSSILMVGIFVFFICTSLVYAILFQQMSVFEPKCEDNFGCLLVDKIITWAIFACFLSIAGYFVIIPLSTGNNPVERSPFINFVAIFIALVWTWIPYAAVETYKKRRVMEPYDQVETTVQHPDYAGSEVRHRRLLSLHYV